MCNMSILIIDDEQAQRESIESFLKRRNYSVITAANGEDGLKVVESNAIDVVLTDFRMPGMNGLEVLKRIKEINPEVDVVVITAYGSVQDAVDILKAGAYDYLTKPIDLDELENMLGRICERRMLVSENRLLKEQLREKYRFETIVSQSKEMEETLNIAGMVANSKATVLIRGESGTGKELIAKAIHYSGERQNHPFVTVNIAALSENLLESELFGHEKGAFTGAVNSRSGKFELADGGTIFLDEIGEVPLSIQVKLLRVLQFGEIERVGSDKVKKIDVRIICATHRNLEEMINAGEFREDLFYRINVVPVYVPPLRKRRSDILLLIDYFIEKFKNENHKEIKGVTKEALDTLMKYDYPGNIRELENIIERAVIFSRDGYIKLKDIPLKINVETERNVLNPLNYEDDYEQKMAAFEKEMLLEAIRISGGNKSAAARMLKISERHLRSRLERLSLK